MKEKANGFMTLKIELPPTGIVRFGKEVQALLREKQIAHTPVSERIVQWETEN